MTNKISYLNEGDVCVVTKDDVSFFDTNLNKVNKKILTLSDDKNESQLGDYKNFMSKEIFEQPQTVKNCLNEYIDKMRSDINILIFQ